LSADLIGEKYPMMRNCNFTYLGGILGELQWDKISSNNVQVGERRQSLLRASSYECGTYLIMICKLEYIAHYIP
jgi:hypothetical protein